MMPHWGQSSEPSGACNYPTKAETVHFLQRTGWRYPMVSSSLFPSGENSIPKTAGVLAPIRDIGHDRWARRMVAALLIIACLATVAYTGLSIYVATQLAHQAPIALQATPASLGLQFRDVSFTSRGMRRVNGGHIIMTRFIF